MNILEEILNALETEDSVMLATVISTTGSTPAASLSKMLVKRGGLVSVGTVGGGCMEGDVLLHAHRLFDSGKAEILTFHLNEDDIERGLICGGSLDVLIEPLTRESLPLLQELKAHQDEGEDSLLATLVKNGAVTEKYLVSPHSLASEISKNRFVVSALQLKSHIAGLPSNIEEVVQRVHQRHDTERLQTSDGDVILEPVAGSPSLIIFGGGHVSKYISRAAALAGFRVTVVDDRDKFANPTRFPEAVQTLAVDFLEGFNRLSIKPSTYIVIVTRGHHHDEEILGRVVETSARYIGMIGSKRKVLTTYGHLIERGISPETLCRVHAPMGIEIGALTAEEIAISVVAELINERRRRGAPPFHKSDETATLISRLENNLQHQ
ncbi:MAG: XdhC family protein [Ignavibacteria bacterium]|nr:XdhC family protein [Ignavibacteria bacterium]